MGADDSGYGCEEYGEEHEDAEACDRSEKSYVVKAIFTPDVVGRYGKGDRHYKSAQISHEPTAIGFATHDYRPIAPKH